MEVFSDCTYTCMASHVLSKKTANSADFFFSTFIKPVAVKSHNAYQTSCTKTAERDGVHYSYSYFTSSTYPKNLNNLLLIDTIILHEKPERNKI